MEKSTSNVQPNCSAHLWSFYYHFYISLRDISMSKPAALRRVTGARPQEHS
jgi:hypothetical protein